MIAVLDSSAVLAVLFEEPGEALATPLLAGGLLSTVNLAETHAGLLRRGVPADFAWDRLLSLGCEICPFTAEQARIAAELAPRTKSYGLSLGDRACLALAMGRKATAYTTDRAWQGLGLEVPIEVLR